MSSLLFFPSGCMAISEINAQRYDFERECVSEETPLVTIEWASDLSLYNTNAACRANGEDGCTATPPVPHETVLFSWGTDGDAYNSMKSWTHTGAAFRLTSINFSAAATGVGSGVTAVWDGSDGHTAGQGVAPAWEWNSEVQDTLLSEARVGVTLTPAGGSAVSATGQLLGSSDTGWYENPPPPYAVDTLATPINYTMLASELSASDIIVDAGTVIVFRLFESFWNGSGEGGPDLVYAPMTIKLYGALV